VDAWLLEVLDLVFRASKVDTAGLVRSLSRVAVEAPLVALDIILV
jgi:hypothetical protein